jgi:hypothetical protein
MFACDAARIRVTHNENRFIPVGSYPICNRIDHTCTDRNMRDYIFIFFPHNNDSYTFGGFR